MTLDGPMMKALLVAVLLITHPASSFKATRRHHAPIQRSYATREDSLLDTNVQAFEESWSSSKIDARKVHHDIVQKYSGFYRGLVTTLPAGKAEPIIEIPLEQCLVANKQYSDALPVELRTVWESLESGYDRLGLLLLLEFLRLPTSPIQSYIKILPAPKTLGTPLHWDNLSTFPYTYLTVTTE